VSSSSPPPANHKRSRAARGRAVTAVTAEFARGRAKWPAPPATAETEE
jgi:hypothetical protein